MPTITRPARPGGAVARPGTGARAVSPVVSREGESLVLVSGPQGYAVLMDWGLLPGGGTVFGTSGQYLVDGQIAALMIAELLPWNAGLVAPPNFVQGRDALPEVRVSDLGAGRRLVDQLPADQQVIYLGIWGACRLLHGSVRYPWPWETVVEPLERRGVGALPALGAAAWWVAGSGLVAAILGAWYSHSETRKAELVANADAARAAQVGSVVAQLAAPYIAAGQPIPDKILDPLKTLATYERVAGGWGPPVVGALAGAAVVGAAWYGGGKGG